MTCQEFSDPVAVGPASPGLVGVFFTSIRSFFHAIFAGTRGMLQSPLHPSLAPKRAARYAAGGAHEGQEQGQAKESPAVDGTTPMTPLDLAPSLDDEEGGGGAKIADPELSDIGQKLQQQQQQGKGTRSKKIVPGGRSLAALSAQNGEADGDGAEAATQSVRFVVLLRAL